MGALSQKKEKVIPLHLAISKFPSRSQKSYTLASCDFEILRHFWSISQKRKRKVIPLHLVTSWTSDRKKKRESYNPCILRFPNFNLSVKRKKLYPCILRLYFQWLQIFLSEFCILKLDKKCFHFEEKEVVPLHLDENRRDWRDCENVRTWPMYTWLVYIYLIHNASKTGQACTIGCRKDILVPAQMPKNIPGPRLLLEISKVIPLHVGRYKNYKKIIYNKRTAAPGIPTSSPTVVLTWPSSIWLQWSDGNWYFARSMAADVG